MLCSSPDGSVSEFAPPASPRDNGVVRVEEIALIDSAPLDTLAHAATSRRAEVPDYKTAPLPGDGGELHTEPRSIKIRVI